MTRFRACVVGDDPEAHLEPFNEDFYGPEKKPWKLDRYGLGTWPIKGYFLLKSGDATDQCRKGEVDWDAMRTADRWPPFVILVNGAWHQRGDAFDKYADEPIRVWDERATALFADVPDDALLSLYECHS